MKSTQQILVFLLLTLAVSSCKSAEQVDVNRISGGWHITEITYKQRGNSMPDSTVSYAKSAFEFGSCQLTASNRECFGYYSLNGLDRAAVTYSISSGEKRLNLSLVDQKNRREVDLTGSFLIEQNDGNIMILSGPVGYTDKNGQFHLQALDGRLTLTR